MEPVVKKCCICKEIKSLEEFYKNKCRKDGHDTKCKVCDKNKPVNKEKANLRNKKWRESEKGREYYKKHYRTYKDRYTKNNKKWYDENKARYQELWRKYANRDSTRKRHKYQEAKRRAQKLKATLSGYDAEIKEIYNNCPKGYHVDHIVPLNNDKVCGLHVPWNLQYLTAEENLKKNNKLLEEYL